MVSITKEKGMFDKHCDGAVIDFGASPDSVAEPTLKGTKLIIHQDDYIALASAIISAESDIIADRLTERIGEWIAETIHDRFSQCPDLFGEWVADIIHDRLAQCPDLSDEE